MGDPIEILRSLPVDRGGLRSGEGLVVGLSGGADSIALTDLLVRLAPELDLRIVAAHLDHGLRPESDDDRRFCADLCRQRWRIPFASARGRVAARAERTGEGIEAAGRALRYAWFERVRRHHRLDRIATAHHLDDHVETVLMWLGRGTGLAGLRGIAPVRGRVLRPLRELRREQLRQYLRDRGISWREDPSNADRARIRNRLRLELVPGLVDLFGEGVLQRIDGFGRRATDDLRALRCLRAERLDPLLRGTTPGSVELDRAGMTQLPELVFAQVLREAIARIRRGGAHQRWNEARYRDVQHFVRTAQSGRTLDLPDGGQLEMARDRLILRAAAAAGADGRPEREADPSGGFELRQELLTTPLGVSSFSGRGCAHFDADRLKPPLRLRSIRPGDRMRPFGMKGHKKLSKLLAEHAVPRSRRHRQLVVEDSEQIVWAVGITTCDGTAVREDTQRVLRVTVWPTESVPDGKSASIRE